MHAVWEYSEVFVRFKEQALGEPIVIEFGVNGLEATADHNGFLSLYHDRSVP